MAQTPMPHPPLDGAPPSPPGLKAGPPPAGMSALVPKPDMGGNMQIIQLGLETAAAVGKGLDLLSQIFPQFAPVAASLQMQLRDGFKVAIQQGIQGSEPSPGPAFGMGMMQGAMQQDSMPPQSSLPSLPSGM